MSETIWELVQSRAIFERSEPNGYEMVKCKLPDCQDHKVRAGFKHEDDSITYHCFNCGTHEKYSEGNAKMSWKFRDILRSIGISDEEIDDSLGQKFLDNGASFVNPWKVKNSDNKPSLVCNTPEVPLPEESVPIKEFPYKEWIEVSEAYLESRGLNIDSHPWHLSTSEKYQGFLIIPFYRNGKVIYWQGRNMDLDAVENGASRYKDCSSKKDAILFGYDRLHDHRRPLVFVTEGAIDAISIDGVALGGSSITECQIEALSNSHKRKVFVIDHDNNGRMLGERVVDLGWDITHLSSQGLDSNKSLSKFGKIWTIKDLMDNIKSGLEAQVFLSMLPEKKQKKTE